MRISLREVERTPAHSTLRVFVNGASAGLLTMTLEEAEAFRNQLAPTVRLACVTLLADYRQVLKDMGGCDHSVGICQCAGEALAAAAADALAMPHMTTPE